jgi:hypothetical protein
MHMRTKCALWTSIWRRKSLQFYDTPYFLQILFPKLKFHLHVPGERCKPRNALRSAIYRYMYYCIEDCRQLIGRQAVYMRPCTLSRIDGIQNGVDS